MQPLREIKPPQVRQFLSPLEDTIYTIIPDGTGTFIVVAHNAYAESEIMHCGWSANTIQEIYNINL